MAEATASSNVFGSSMATCLHMADLSPARNMANIIAGLAPDLACLCFSTPAKSITLCSLVCFRLLKSACFCHWARLSPKIFVIFASSLANVSLSPSGNGLAQSSALPLIDSCLKGGRPANCIWLSGVLVP